MLGLTQRVGTGEALMNITGIDHHLIGKDLLSEDQEVQDPMMMNMIQVGSF